MLCLAAVALLCWPSRPGLLRLDGTASVSAPTSGTGRSRGRLSRRGGRTGVGRSLDAPAFSGRPAWVLLVVALGAAALPAGPAATCAALLIGATLALLTSAELRRRRDSKQIGMLLVATRTLAREVRTGASPVTAVLATAAAHPGCSAALSRLAAAVVGRRGGSATSVDPGAVDEVDQQSEVVARLSAGWELSARYGVPWAALVETVATDLADRQRAESLRNAQVAGPRVSGYVLAVLPALGILLGAGMGADPIHVLLGTGVGAVLLLVGSTLTCLGLAWTASIVRS
jgi:tight adherence protein B